MLMDASKTPSRLTEVVVVKPVSTDHSAKKVSRVLCYLSLCRRILMKDFGVCVCSGGGVGGVWGGYGRPWALAAYKK